MLKKWFSISLFLSASISLLAHSVLQHHHHEEAICLETEHCDTGLLDPEDHKNHHDHHGDENSEYCPFMQQIVLPVKVYRQFQKIILFNPIAVLGQVICLASSSELAITEISSHFSAIHFKSIPLIPNGLRAPPFN